MLWEPRRAVGSVAPAQPCQFLCGFNDVNWGPAGALLVGAVGGVVGLVIGANIPDWEPAPGWHAAPRLTFDRGRPGIGLSIAF